MINSIDAATMLPRTIEAADVAGRENHLANNAVHQTGEQFQQKVEQQHRQTVETQKTETNGDADQGSGKGDVHYARKKQKAKEKEAPVAPRSNSSFDIMI